MLELSPNKALNEQSDNCVDNFPYPADSQWNFHALKINLGISLSCCYVTSLLIDITCCKDVENTSKKNIIIFLCEFSVDKNSLGF